MKLSKYKLMIFLVLIFLASFFLRFYGMTANYPFWVDEFFTASQANVFLKYGLFAFNNTKVYFEYHNIIPHILVATFFKLFGQQEWVARLPFVIIGSFVPLAVFFLARKIFNTVTAISASLLTTFSYLQITWSRQARGYVLQQLLILTVFYLYLKIVKSPKKSTFYFALLIFILILGILTHVTFYLLILALVIHYLFLNQFKISSILKKFWFYLVCIFFLLIIFKTGSINTLIEFYNSKSLGANNLWYYHSFLWREYGLITFLAILGFFMGFLQKRKQFSLVVIYVFIHLLFVSFVFKPYISRYLLPVFPILFIAFSYTLTQLTTLMTKNKNYQTLILITITLFIIGNGYKFVNKPKKYYSVNHDFREIANIDYHQIYNLVKQKIQKQPPPVAIIETLPDRTGWYLGYDYQPIYLFRWGNEEGLVNGLVKKTASVFNDKGEKVVSGTDLKLVTDLSDLRKVVKRYPQGFIFIDDWSMSKEIIDYAKENFKQELYLDHYPLDDNPYSIWPATLYSWGIN